MTLGVLFVLAVIGHAASQPTSEGKLVHGSNNTNNNNNDQTQTNNDKDTLAYTVIRNAIQCTIIDGTKNCSIVHMNCTKLPEQDEKCTDNTSSSTGKIRTGDGTSFTIKLPDFGDLLDNENDNDIDMPWPRFRELTPKLQRFISTFWKTADPFDNDENKDSDETFPGFDYLFGNGDAIGKSLSDDTEIE